MIKFHYKSGKLLFLTQTDVSLLVILIPNIPSKK